MEGPALFFLVVGVWSSVVWKIPIDVPGATCRMGVVLDVTGMPDYGSWFWVVRIRVSMVFGGANMLERFSGGVVEVLGWWRPFLGYVCELCTL